MEKAIFIGSDSLDRYFDIYNAETREKLYGTLSFFDKLITKENIHEFKEELKEVKYAFSSWGMAPLTEEEIEEYLPKLEAVFYAAGSVQGFARPFLNKGVKVYSAFAANGVPVAEYTVAQIVLACKGFFSSNLLYKKFGKYAGKEVSQSFYGNYNANIGIIGAGAIGRMVIERLKAYDYNIFVYDKFLSEEEIAELGGKKASLEEIFENCHVVSNHFANSDALVKVFTYDLFSRMMDYSVFINTGRGRQVDEDALVKVLKENPKVTAVLDVTFPEPVEEGHDFYKLDNVILTPHIAGSLSNEVQRMGEYMYGEYSSLIDGKDTKYEVSLKMLETMA